MKSIELSKTPGSITQYTKQIKSSPLILTRRGQPAFAIYRLDKDEIERLKLSKNKKFNAILQKSKKSLAVSGGIPLDSLD